MTEQERGETVLEEEPLYVLTTVQIIQRKSDLTLVQWDDEATPMRAWVTPSMIHKQVDSKTALVMAPWEGVPYGEDWTRMLEIPHVTPELIDRELKRKGIWTIDDLQARSNVARKALMNVYTLDIAKLLNAAAIKQANTGGKP